MNKKVYAAVMERADGRCEWCKEYYCVVAHHIIHGNGKRQQHETVESVIALCDKCHTKVHGKDGHDTDIEMKLRVQQTYFNQGMSETEVRRWLGGKIY